jgi:hypothetical protein
VRYTTGQGFSDDSNLSCCVSATVGTTVVSLNGGRRYRWLPKRVSSVCAWRGRSVDPVAVTDRLHLGAPLSLGGCPLHHGGPRDANVAPPFRISFIPVGSTMANLRPQAISCLESWRRRSQETWRPSERAAKQKKGKHPVANASPGGGFPWCKNSFWANPPP